MDKMRFALVTVGTALATAGVVTNAFMQKKQFYPSVVFLTKSNSSMAVLYAQVFVLVFLIGKALRKIFFGQLRAAELEHLIEKFWYVITETCLAFTAFREDLSARFVALFTFLLFMKAFHWLMEDRVDYMERSPLITFIFHARIIVLMVLLGVIDSLLIQHAFETTLKTGASVQLVFGFEYAILLTMVVAVCMKYVLHTIDYNREHTWESKNVYLLYSELITGFVKCTLYIVFVGVMVKIHTFPLFAIRPMYLCIKSFKQSLSDVILSRRAVTYMNTRFPDATEEELVHLDNTCIICREIMMVGKKLPCNHVFHTYCLRSWFQRQQSCPTCRMDVLTQAANMPNVVPQQQQQQQPQPQPPQQPHTNLPFTMPQQPNNQDNTPVTPQVQPAFIPNMNNTFTSPLPFAPPFNTFSPPFNAFFTPPPPPPAFMGFSTFTPPHVDLSSIPEEQLRAMEGQERANVEARVRVLRNVHSLLDSAIVQLNQYSQAIQAINVMGQVNGDLPSPSQQPSTSQQPSPSQQSSTSQQPLTSQQPSTSQQPLASQQQASTSSPQQPSTFSEKSSTIPQQPSTASQQVDETSVETLPTSEHNDESNTPDNSEQQVATSENAQKVDESAELRRRRLERFESRTDNS